MDERWEGTCSPVEFAWKVSRSINGFWVKNWIIHAATRGGYLAAARRACCKALDLPSLRMISVERRRKVGLVG